MIETLDDFKEKFAEICSLDWVDSHRNGPTGVGKTLEDLLGIKENNIDGPDFGVYELKSCRIDSNSMLTMFTKTPGPRGAVTTLRKEFGYSSSAYDNTEKVLHASLTAARPVRIADTGRSLSVVCTDDRISIADESGKEWAFWTRDQLQRAFEKKYKGQFVYAKAEARMTEKGEQFRFKEAYEMSGFDFKKFTEMLKDGSISIDLRIGQYHGGKRDGKTHDHGTGFRIRDCDMERLFQKQTPLVSLAKQRPAIER